MVWNFLVPFSSFIYLLYLWTTPINWDSWISWDQSINNGPTINSFIGLVVNVEGHDVVTSLAFCKKHLKSCYFWLGTKYLFFFICLWFSFSSWSISTHLTVQCFKYLVLMDNHIYLFGAVALLFLVEDIKISYIF